LLTFLRSEPWREKGMPAKVATRAVNWFSDFAKKNEVCDLSDIRLYLHILPRSPGNKNISTLDWMMVWPRSQYLTFSQHKISTRISSVS
jgi:hypothetical protein